jgi:hypothetical protein
MARKAPNFGGFTLEDIAKANEGNSIVKNSNANISTAINSNAENDSAIRVIDYKTTNISLQDNNSNANNSNAKNDTTAEILDYKTNHISPKTDNSNAKNVNQALFARVKNYLYGLLGDKESVEVKFSDVIKDLAINPHSFYKYLQTLRETDFIITQLRHSTEIRRRSLS